MVTARWPLYGAVRGLEKIILYTGAKPFYRTNLLCPAGAQLFFKVFLVLVPFSIWEIKKIIVNSDLFKIMHKLTDLEVARWKFEEVEQWAIYYGFDYQDVILNIKKYQVRGTHLLAGLTAQEFGIKDPLGIFMYTERLAELAARDASEKLNFSEVKYKEEVRENPFYPSLVNEVRMEGLQEGLFPVSEEPFMFEEPFIIEQNGYVEYIKQRVNHKYCI
jgi:hypothetical protein